MERRDLLTVGFMAILVLGAVFISGCVEEENPTKAQTTAPTTQQETQESTPPTELILKVGETAKTSKLEITVVSAKKVGYYTYYSDIFEETMTERASPGKIYVLVDAEIKNVGSDRVYVGAGEFSLMDSEGYRYDPDILYLGDDGLDALKELYKGQKIRGKVLFEVPDSASGLKLQYDFGDLLVGTKLASWTIG